LISVVMPVYNPDLQWLREAIESVRTQVYPEWELCMADDNSKDPGVRQLLTEYAAKDERIRVEFRKTNGHISAASNSALSLATGDYVAFLDHDDLLAPDALLRVAYEIGHHRDVGLIYSDEDKIEPDGKRNGPYFKPDWSPELLESQNYLCHLTVIRTDLVREVGGFRLGFEGSQDYDLVLRCTEKLRPEQIRHIPHILYHWRIHKNSTAMNVDLKPYAWDAGRRAIAEHFDRIGMGVTVTVSPENSLFYRIKPTERNESDLVTIIIPTRNHRTSLETCLNSLLQKTEYHNFEILIVDNGSDEPETLAYLRSITADSRVRVIRDDGPFNFSRLNNRAVRYANGEFVLLLNNDVEVINPDWLDEMLFYARRPGVGVVGARLWYRDERLQHAGVILGVGGVAGHAFSRYPRGKGGYAGLAALVQNRSAVTGACLLTRRSIYQAVGGLDEAGLSVAFNDVDYCLKVLKSGRRIVWTPFAELYHDESLSRGFEDTPEKILRFQRECILMKKRWGPLLQNDPYFNPNLALEQECEAMAFPARSKRYPDFE
jgi:glycosyltransferase involved in cell wall biosynthesis